jgi:hypothetical protein
MNNVLIQVQRFNLWESINGEGLLSSKAKAGTRSSMDTGLVLYDHNL